MLRHVIPAFMTEPLLSLLETINSFIKERVILTSARTRDGRRYTMDRNPLYVRDEIV